MPKRIANIVVLAEDQEQEILARRYLLRTGHGRRDIRVAPRAASRGSGSQRVREQFPHEVAACRATRGRGAAHLLVAITDADELTTTQRERTLVDELKKVGQEPLAAEEPVIILIPKWQVETWIKCLLGQPMDELDKKSDQPPVSAEQIKQAASVLYAWTRTNAAVGATCVPSLRAALPRWRKLG